MVQKEEESKKKKKKQNVSTRVHPTIPGYDTDITGYNQWTKQTSAICQWGGVGHI